MAEQRYVLCVVVKLLICIDIISFGGVLKKAKQIFICLRKMLAKDISTPALA